MPRKPCYCFYHVTLNLSPVWEVEELFHVMSTWSFEWDTSLTTFLTSSGEASISIWAFTVMFVCCWKNETSRFPRCRAPDIPLFRSHVRPVRRLSDDRFRNQAQTRKGKYDIFHAIGPVIRVATFKCLALLLDMSAERRYRPENVPKIHSAADRWSDVKH